jgi:hypothetical protein
MVLHNCNLSTWEANAGRTGIQASVGYTRRPVSINKNTITTKNS